MPLCHYCHLAQHTLLCEQPPLHYSLQHVGGHWTPRQKNPKYLFVSHVPHFSAVFFWEWRFGEKVTELWNPWRFRYWLLLFEMQLELSVVRNHREQQFYLSRSHFPKMFFFEIVSTRLLIQRPLKQSMQGMRWTDIESLEQLSHIILHGFKYQIVQQRHFQSWTLNSKRIRFALEFKVPRAKERSRSKKKVPHIHVKSME